MDRQQNQVWVLWLIFGWLPSTIFQGLGGIALGKAWSITKVFWQVSIHDLE